MIINFCLHAACVEFLTIGEKDIFQCVSCGPRLNVLVIDRIAMGLQKSVLYRYEDIVAEELADKISGPEFSDIGCQNPGQLLFLPDRTGSPIIMWLKFGHQTSKMMSSFQMNSCSKFYLFMKFLLSHMWMFFSSLRYLDISIMYKGLIASQIFTHNLTVLTH